jgi:hypothetical protein
VFTYVDTHSCTCHYKADSETAMLLNLFYRAFTFSADSVYRIFYLLDIYTISTLLLNARESITLFSPTRFLDSLSRTHVYQLQQPF